MLRRIAVLDEDDHQRSFTEFRAAVKRRQENLRWWVRSLPEVVIYGDRNEL